MSVPHNSDEHAWDISMETVPDELFGEFGLKELGFCCNGRIWSVA